MEQPPVTTTTEDQDSRDGMRGALAVLALVLILLVILWWYFSRTARVPDIIGLASAKARSEIAAAGFVVGKVTTVTAPGETPGTVVDQDPYGGRRAMRGSAISFEVAAGEGGQTGTDEGTFGQEPDTSMEITYTYVSGTAADNGEYYQNTVYPPSVPNVLNLTYEQAVAKLKAAGYRMGTVTAGPATSHIAAGRIYFQDPAPEDQDPKGTTVNVWVSTGPPVGGYPFPQPPKTP